MLRRKVGSFLQGSLWGPLLKALPACVLMGGVVWQLLGLVDWSQQDHGLEKGLCLFAAVTLGGIVYLGSCMLFRVDEVKQGLNLLRRRKARTKP
jgi:putative peptidoglycan lipid II flippase